MQTRALAAGGFLLLIASLIVGLTLNGCRPFAAGVPGATTNLTEVVAASPTWMPAARPTSTPTPLATPSPSSTATVVPLATATPSPTPTVAPTVLIGRLKQAEIVAGPKTGNRVAFTFDAGSGAEWTPPILTALSDAHLHVTFFMTGRWAEQHPALLREIVAAGHELGNHSYSHPDLTRLDDQTVIAEVEKTEMIVHSLTGRSTKPYFRFPFGARDRHRLDLIVQQGYVSIFWTLDSADWRPELKPEEIRDRVIKNAAAGDIIVFHADSPQTAHVLPEIIRGVQAKGLQIGSLSALLLAGTH